MSRAQLTSTVEQNTGGAVAPFVAGKNAVINGGFDIWARGTSISIAASINAYNADRWYAGGGANEALTISRQATGDTTNLPNIQYCARVQRNSGQTGTSYIQFTTSFESINSIPFAGKSVTLSFYARAGANYSYAGNALPAFVLSGTGTDQNYASGYTGSSTVVSGTATLTTTWQRFSYTGTVSTTATELAIQFGFNPTGTAGTNDYFEVTGVQLEIGSVATPFSRAGGTLQGELALCQRYYQRISSVNATTAYMHFGMGQAYSTSAAKVPIPLKVTMRTAPSISSTGSIGLLNSVNTAINNASLAVEAGPGNSPDVCSLVATGSSGLTAGNATTLIANANNTCYLEISAEL